MSTLGDEEAGEEGHEGTVRPGTCQVSRALTYAGSLDGPLLGHMLAISPRHSRETSPHPLGESLFWRMIGDALNRLPHEYINT